MKLNERGLLVVISGPSGVGKGTICEKLIKDLIIKRKGENHYDNKKVSSPTYLIYFLTMLMISSP